MKSVSGTEVIRALARTGFVFMKQKGSHVKLRKITPDGKRTAIVPLHRDISEELSTVFQEKQASHSKNSKSFSKIKELPLRFLF